MPDTTSPVFWAGFLAFIGGALSTKLFTRYVSRRKLMIGLTILNALTMATTVTGRDGHRVEAIDFDRVKALMVGPFRN